MGEIPFWQLVKKINGKEVVAAQPPDDWEPDPPDTGEDLEKIMKERPEGRAA